MCAQIHLQATNTILLKCEGCRCSLSHAQGSTAHSITSAVSEKLGERRHRKNEKTKYVISVLEKGNFLFKNSSSTQKYKNIKKIFIREWNLIPTKKLFNTDLGKNNSKDFSKSELENFSFYTKQDALFVRLPSTPPQN